MNLSTNQTRAAQIELNKAGLLISVDGSPGPQTKGALDRYVDEHGLFPLGRVSAALELAEKCSAWIGLVENTPTPRVVADVAQMAEDFALTLDPDVGEAFAQLFTGLRGSTPAEDLVARVATWFLYIGVKEERANRGKWVDVIIKLGGGRPSDAPPWCAYFVAACREIASRVAEPRFSFYRSGSAIRTYQGADAYGRKIEGHPELDLYTVPNGAAFARLRSSVPSRDVADDLAAVRRGNPRQGHTGIKIATLPNGDALCVAGNSSGSGHSGGRGGRVALEVIGPTLGEEAFERLVGFSTVTQE